MNKETVREESSLDLRYQKHIHFPPPLDFIAFKKSKSFLRLMNHFQAIAKTKNLDNPNLQKIEKNIHLTCASKYMLEKLTLNRYPIRRFHPSNIRNKIWK